MLDEFGPKISRSKAHAKNFRKVVTGDTSAYMPERKVETVKDLINYINGHLKGYTKTKDYQRGENTRARALNEEEKMRLKQKDDPKQKEKPKPKDDPKEPQPNE